jgi:GT2 family glycosyltransferase
MEVSIIIVNYNTCKMTQDCINSIIMNTHDVNYEIILVDNASQDMSRSTFEKDHRIKYIFNESNIGFGQANNIGLTYARGEYLLLLNSDTLINRNIICDMLKFQRNNNDLEIGVLGSVLENHDGEYSLSYGEFLSLKSVVKRILHFFVLRSKVKTIDSKFQNREYTIVDYVIGADLFISKFLFKELNGFNSNYFMFYEEEDLQMRIKKLGKKCVIINKKGIVHLESKSFESKFSFDRSMRLKQSCNIFMNSHLEGFEYYIVVVHQFLMRFKNLFFVYRHFSIKQKMRYLF